MPKKPDAQLLTKIQEMMTSYQKGYRSNALLDEIRPHVHEKQRWFLGMEHREVLYGGAAGGGKQLNLQERVVYWRSRWNLDPTNTILPIGNSAFQESCIMLGFVGDLKVGDFVIGSDGRPTQILATSVPEVRQYYRIHFDDECWIEASDDHRWTVFDLSKRAKGSSERGTYQTTITTEYLYETGLKYRSQNRFAIPLLRGPVQSKKSKLPGISPYLLGYWLGNGAAQGSSLTCHSDDVYEIYQLISQASPEVTAKITEPEPGTNRSRISLSKWIQTLVEFGWKRSKLVSGNYKFDKGMPFEDWRLWSMENRLLLLQGLMDSDGHANLRGDFEFDNTSLQIVSMVQSIMQSLGLKPSAIRQKKVRENEQPLYRICGISHIQLFRLARKANRLKLDTIRQVRQSRRYITKIERVGKQKGMCIKVAAKDGLFVVGDGYIVTHNSDALLMAALQYIDIPNYAALLLRRTYADLEKAGALLDRASNWLSGTIMKKQDGGKKWSYPGGGKIEFGYLDSDDDKFKYKSSEYQVVCVDELTEFPEDHYTYLFSRIRKPARHCPECFSSEEDSLGKTARKNCRICAGLGVNPLHFVPLRMRAASNPGGKFGDWVKRNFITKAYLNSVEDHQFSHIWTKSGECILCYGQKKIEVLGKLEECPACSGHGHTERYFIPARLEDNRSLDHASYEMNLAALDATERAQLRHGRWDFMSDGTLFKREWIKHYGWRGEHIELYNPEGKRLIENRSYIVFMTADTASKTKTTNDYTCICVWALCVKTAALCLLEVFRKRIIVPEILPEIHRLRDKWKAGFIVVEEASSGITIIQEIVHTERGRGMTVLPYSPHTGDKVARSNEAQIRMRNGQVFFPDTRDDTIAECINEMLLFFTPEVHDDFVDNLSMASWYASGQWRNKSAGKPGQIVRPGCRAPISRFRVF